MFYRVRGYRLKQYILLNRFLQVPTQEGAVTELITAVSTSVQFSSRLHAVPLSPTRVVD